MTDKIQIYILTRYQCDNNSDAYSKSKEFKDEIARLLKLNNVRDYNITIKCNYSRNKARLWHDRYLIIDGKDVYLVGTSMSELVSSTKSFGIYHINNMNDRNLIISKMKECDSSCLAEVNSVKTSYGKKIEKKSNV